MVYYHCQEERGVKRTSYGLPVFSKKPLKRIRKCRKPLDNSLKMCYNKGTDGEGSATREELADPRESVRHSPKTPTAWSPVVRYINVNQALRTQPQTAGRGTAGRGKKIFLKKYLTFYPVCGIIIPERERTPQIERRT